jgi:CBS domain-containing protein
VANSALWLGLMEGLADEVGDVAKRMPFDDARQNYVAAARLGLAASFSWLDGETLPAQTLICDRLLPIARAGLEKRGIDASDIDRYLGIIEERVASGRTGAMWLVRSFEGLDHGARTGERLAALTATMVERQRDGTPVAQWPLARADEAMTDFPRGYGHVEHFMATDLFTVQEDEPIDLVASLMDWKHLRHVAVEDNLGRLVGIVSYRALLRLLATGYVCDGRAIAASEVMRRDPISIAPETPTVVAIALMRQHGVSALPVVENDVLVGMVTERDFMDLASHLLEEKLTERTEQTEQTERPDPSPRTAARSQTP